MTRMARIGSGFSCLSVSSIVNFVVSVLKDLATKSHEKTRTKLRAKNNCEIHETDTEQEGQLKLELRTTPNCSKLVIKKQGTGVPVPDTIVSQLSLQEMRLSRSYAIRFFTKIFTGNRINRSL